MRLLDPLVVLFLACAVAAQAPPASGAGPAGPRTEQKPPQKPTEKPDAGKEQGKPQQDPGKTGPVTKPPAGKEGPVTNSGEDDDDDEPIVSPTQLPASADPQDIAAMQSAQAMLKAEARLRKLLKKGAIQGIDKILTFEEISGWPYQDGLKGMPEPVKKMDGKAVLMTGFMLPIDEVEDIKEFLLVQSLWSCCYGQPPDINGIVRVVMKGDKRIDYKYDPIKVTGQFKVVASFEDGYCIDIYQLEADEVEVIK